MRKGTCLLDPGQKLIGRMKQTPDEVPQFLRILSLHLPSGEPPSQHCSFVVIRSSTVARQQGDSTLKILNPNQCKRTTGGLEFPSHRIRTPFLAPSQVIIAQFHPVLAIRKCSPSHSKAGDNLLDGYHRAYFHHRALLYTIGVQVTPFVILR